MKVMLLFSYIILFISDIDVELFKPAWPNISNGNSKYVKTSSSSLDWNLKSVTVWTGLLIEYSNVAKDIQNKIDTLKTLLEVTTNYIQNNCKHQIEHDYIDISPDKMINISYCTICGNNFT